MATDWLKHYREVYATEINRLKLKDIVGFAFSGPMFVPTPQGSLALGWSLMLTLKHDKLLGQPDIGVHIPVIGMTPEDNIIRRGAEFLLDEARKERHKMETVPQQAEPEVLEGIVHSPPRQADGSPLPPGLLPPGIGGAVTQRRVQQSPREGGLPSGFKAKAEGVATDLEGKPIDENGEPKPDENIKELPNREAVVSDSDSGTFKIVDRRGRK